MKKEDIGIMTRRFATFFALVGGVFLCGCVARAEHSALSADLVYTEVGRPAVGAVRVDVPELKGSKILRAGSESESLWISAFPDAVPESGVFDVSFVIFPECAGEFLASVSVELSQPAKKVLRCNVQGIVGGKGVAVPNQFSTLRKLCHTAGARLLSLPDASLYCAPIHVSGTAAVFIDIRTADDFRASHIPGALNIPAYAVASKTFLSGKNIVLIDSGLGQQETEGLCRRINLQAGYSCRILDGGVAEWRASGYSLAGQRGDAITTIKGDELGCVAQRGNWQTLFVGTNTTLAAIFFPENISIPLADVVRPCDRVDRILAAVPQGRRILVLGDAGVPKAVLARVAKISERNVCAADGGLEAYVQHLVLRSNVHLENGNVSAHFSKTTGGGRMSSVGGVRKRGGCGCSGS
jgi:rhodanese-related sulfurtransferase